MNRAIITGIVIAVLILLALVLASHTGHHAHIGGY